METLKIKNLDQFYSTVKAEAGHLMVAGWDAKFESIHINGAETLLEWFFNNIATLKSGVDKLLIAYASGTGNYAVYCDTISVSTQVTQMGLLVKLERIANTDNGCHGYSGGFETFCHTWQQEFLLKTE